MTSPLPDDADGVLADGAGSVALELAAERDAIAVGPGIGTSAACADAVLELLRGRRVPACLDADGLNLVASRSAVDGLATGHPPLVMTPHPGEAARLLACSTADVQADRRGAAVELARRSGAVVLLKGHRTLVARPDGHVSVNASGNPGMATAGTGDVLTGAVAALLARGLDAATAARLGAFVHGDAGDRAAAELGPDGMIASDLVDRLPAALAALLRRAS
jgi:NAD(P)H-hydrate epimerase